MAKTPAIIEHYLEPGALIRNGNAFGSNDRLPLYSTDANGNSAIAAYLRPLSTRGFHVEPCRGGSPLLLRLGESGVIDDLPYYFQDLRPQGFNGRQIALELSMRI